MAKSEFNTDLAGKKFPGIVKEIIKPKSVNKNGTINQVYKLRVYIEPLHSGITDPAELPIYGIKRSLFRGISKGVGLFQIPRVGSTVLVEFDSGNEKAGVVVGEYLDGAYLDLDSEIFFDKEYNIKSYGWKDEFGNYQITSTDNGTSTENYVKDKNIILQHGDYSLVVSEGNCSTNITVGSSTLDAKKNINLKSQNSSLNLQNSAITIKLGSSTIVLSDNSINVKSPTIILEGEVIVNGSISGGGNGTLQIKGDTNVSGDATISGIKFSKHIHSSGTLSKDSPGDIHGNTGVPT